MRLETTALTKIYGSRTNKKRSFVAVENASISIGVGETVGLLGESGSGKTTLGMMVAGLTRPSHGTIVYEGRTLRHPYKGEIRRRIQILFQHPEVSFNPALPIIKSMVEPYKLYSPPFTMKRLLNHIGTMGLYGEHLQRLPSQLSGGELQRLALARLLVVEPALVVLDEPTSMLDVISQAQIIELLKIYQDRTGASFLLITHDTALAETVCDRTYAITDGAISLRRRFDSVTGLAVS